MSGPQSLGPGREFDAVETDLQRAWAGSDLGRGHGEWSAVRRYALDAYGHARSGGAGVRRAAGVIGSAGSAVDPVELDRARAGLSSVDATPGAGTIAYDHPGYADATTGATGRGTGAGGSGGLGERPEVDANTAHRRDPELH